MAGIGFVLRKLSQKDNLFGSVQAFFHALIASSGPWLFTVLSLGVIIAVGDYFTTHGAVEQFRSIIIYNFAFSLVISGPIFLVCTRFLADEIHRKDLSYSIGMLYGATLVISIIQLSLSVWFYCIYSNLPTIVAVNAVINYMLIVLIWMAAIFLSAMKNYQVTTYAFIGGIIVSVLCSSFMAESYGVLGMLIGFSIGLALIVSIMGARILIEYPYKPKKIFTFLKYFPKYWELALAGLFYNLGSWADKFIMWFSPEALAEKGQSSFFMYPNYDSAMFLAYLSIVPALAIFVYQIETDFYQKYVKFYSDSLNNANLDKIFKNQQNLINSFTRNSIIVFILQAAIAAVLILAAPHIFRFIHVNYTQMGIFRYGIIGSTFQIFFLFFTIILAYFDNRKGVLKCYVLFFVLNSTFTVFTLYMGFDYYGMGYAYAAILSFVYAAYLCIRNLNNLPYVSFITNNTSIAR
ncbi:exopolysaccharide Pel transporter PelG [Francisellaceae bacterium]|nr:exopolysaccharide Pel transporter PelG [Francisellaceae bacterium]